MSAPIRVAIRADAGRSLGTGHYARASALADAVLAAGDTDVVLLTGAEGAPLIPSYFQEQIRVLELARGSDGPEQALAALRAEDGLPDVLVLDHYGEVPEWEALASAAHMALLVFDDLDAASTADIIIRPHGGPAAAPGSVVLRGPAYLPLSRHVRELAQQHRKRDASKRLRLNICFGGTDPTGETGKALTAVAELPRLDADVVLGPGARIDPAVVDTAAGLPNVTLHHAPSPAALAGLIASADMALGAGGVMLWERMCLGVPSLVIAAAENQRPQIDAMVKAGALRFIGDNREVTAVKIGRAVAELAADESARKNMAATGQQLVDGRGVSRLAAWIRALSLGTRPVTPGDGEDLLRWRTDDRNWRHNWEGSGKPSLDAHLTWFAARLADVGCVFRIVTREEEPVGVVRFDLSDEGRAAYLSIYLVPTWHGRKMGLPVYLAGERELRRSHPDVRQIVSRIHMGNTASERLHRDAGFKIGRSVERDDWLDAVKSID